MADIHPITDEYAAADIIAAIQNLPKRLRTWPATHLELPIGQAWAKTLTGQPPATTQKALKLRVHADTPPDPARGRMPNPKPAGPHTPVTAETMSEPHDPDTPTRP